VFGVTGGAGKSLETSRNVHRNLRIRGKNRPVGFIQNNQNAVCHRANEFFSPIKEIKESNQITKSPANDRTGAGLAVVASKRFGLIL
jgi:hypothetical protein